MAKQGIDIVTYMRDGKLVPKEIIQGVLEDTLASNVKAGKNHILLDGFPRSMDQTKLFEASVSTRTSSKAAVLRADLHVGLQDQGGIVFPRVQRHLACLSTQSIQDLWPS